MTSAALLDCNTGPAPQDPRHKWPRMGLDRRFQCAWPVAENLWLSFLNFISKPQPDVNAGSAQHGDSELLQISNEIRLKIITSRSSRRVLFTTNETVIPQHKRPPSPNREPRNLFHSRKKRLRECPTIKSRDRGGRRHSSRRPNARVRPPTAPIFVR